MQLEKLLSGADIPCPDEYKNIEITNIVSDSRRVTKGSMFVCISGLHTDGHDYIKNAVDAGASVIVTEVGRDECVGGAATVKVNNTRRAISLLYNTWHGNPAKRLKIIGVTGTNGKTSTVYILHQIFEGCGYRCGMIGTVECRSNGRKINYAGADPLSNMTTPDPDVLYRMLAEMVDDGVEYVFMEATSHASALSKLDGIIFDTLVFTNLTQDHLDFHGTMQEYLAAKAALFERCRRAVINIDDKYAPDILGASRAEKNILCSCENKKSDYVASNICLGGGNGVFYKLVSEKAIFDAKIPLAGRFSVMNSLEAIVVAIEHGISGERISALLPHMTVVPGRMERIIFENAPRFSVYIDYAHTPDALENLLRTARDIEHDGKIILLFGCGGERDRGKRKEMAQIASRFSDFVIVTSDNSRSEDPIQIISDIYKGINKEKPHIIVVERESAIRFAISIAEAGDIVILAGKGHEKYEISSNGRKPFDEIEIVKNAVSERYGHKS